MELDKLIEDQLGADFGKELVPAEEPPTADSPCPSLRFDVITRFFNKVLEVRGRDKSKFIKTFTAHLFRTHRNHSYVYGILRLILPGEDRERGNYGAKEKSLAIILRDSLGLPSKDYERLKHYKNPSYHPDGLGMGDFPMVAANICGRFCQQTSSMTVQRVNKILDEMVKKTDTK